MYNVKKRGNEMDFMQVTLGDVIGYILIISGFTISISISMQVHINPHHNKKDVNKVNQSRSEVKGDQVGRDKK